MKHHAILFPILLGITLSTTVTAQINRNQARNALRRAAGFELTGGAVRVKSVADSTISASVRTVFKFQKDTRGNWRVAELRTGQDSWENIDSIATALGSSAGVAGSEDCNAPDPPFRGSLATDPSPKRARCLLGRLLGIDVPSDAVRIQEVATLGIPFSSESSAVVTAWISVDARAARDKSGWRITEVRTGNREWVNLDSLIAALNQEKQRRARTELEAMAKALEEFRRDRGYYVVSESQAALIDHISPKYLRPVLRLDPWNQPYQYLGTRDQFTLASPGPDRKVKTADDISLSRAGR